ncbi:MAG: PQQ-binding-like beta-propeller repeat protein [Candidatus Omnitrophica bacterium]|nr:PQQ-binding-like beta-propeller repeat protein [Candidatus Omnitrophota bacterium]
MNLFTTISNHSSPIVWIAAVIVAAAAGLVQAEDWPTHRRDNYRSAITSESIQRPLQRQWISSSFIPPQTAWAGPAKWDSYANIMTLKSMRDFDPVFYTTVAGDSVFWGSSVDDSVHCVGLADGADRWTFCTDGPVRAAPTWYKKKVYVGSDDGYVYCLNANDGSLVWSFKPTPDAPRISNNGKLISPWPCRTGVLVQDGVAYFAASLLPWSESYLCAVNAETGSDQGEGFYIARHQHAAMQGPILASSTKLYLSHGRQQPHVYDLQTGELLGSIGRSGDGGCFAILTQDDVLFHGRGQNHKAEGELRGFNAQSQDHLATFPQANCMVVKTDMAYLHSKGELTAFDRAKNIVLQSQKNECLKKEEDRKKEFKKLNDPKAETEQAQKLLSDIQAIQNEIKQIDRELPSTIVWKTDVPIYESMILAGNVLVVGGKNLVAAHDAATGELIWSDAVEGNAYGLTYANGHLLVSTDLGNIICYAHKP